MKRLMFSRVLTVVACALMLCVLVPTITSLTPNTGSVDASVNVSLTGTNLTGTAPATGAMTVSGLTPARSPAYAGNHGCEAVEFHYRGKKKWGVAARTEAQWRHLFEAFEIFGVIDIHNWPKYRVLP